MRMNGMKRDKAKRQGMSPLWSIDMISLRLGRSIDALR